MKKDLPPDLRALAEAWCAETEPPRERVEAGLAALVERIEAGGVPPGGGGGASAGAAAKGIVVAALAVGAAYGLARLGSDGPERGRPERPALAVPADPGEPTAERAAVPTDPGAPGTERAGAPSARTRSSPGQTRAVTGAARPPDDGGPKASERRRRRSRPRRTGAAEGPGSGDPLFEDLMLMRRARRALRAGDGRRALALVDEHRRRFPDSEFAEERAATEVMALCRLGEVARAKAKARHYRAKYPTSAFGAGLLEACEADAAPEGGGRRGR